MKQFRIVIFIILLMQFLSKPVLANTEYVKTIRVGGDYKYPPYEFLDSNGKYKGFNVEIIERFAKEFGYKVEFVPIEWGDALNALENGKVDVIQGANKTNERKENLLFSDSYVINEEVIFTLKDTVYISSTDDLKGRKVSVQKGDTGEDIAKKIENINIITTSSQEEAVKLLFNGKVDAFIGNKTVGFYFAQKEDMLKKIKITGDVLQRVEYCLVTTKGNEKLINQFNKGLKLAKEDSSYNNLSKKWFGESAVYTEDTWRKVTGIVILIGTSLSAVVGIVLFINNRLKIKIYQRTRELEEVNEVVMASEKKHRKFIEHCPYAIFVHNMDDIILFVNEEGKRLLGTNSKKDIVGKDIKQFLGVTSYLNDIKKSKLEYNVYEKKMYCLDGSKIFVEVKGSIVEHEGEECIYSMITDISERKRLFEAIEYDKIKTEFFANISHELRTPLNVILASLQLMKTKIESHKSCAFKSDIDKSIVNIRNNGQRLLKLVNNLIDITKIDSGYISLNLKNGNIIDVIENITISVVEYAEVKGIEVVFDTEVEEVLMAYDEDKVERIILNLLSNAVKFGKENGNILVKTEIEEGNLLITVKDDGVGIPKDKLMVIFDRFIQVEESLIRSFEGSGIGLSLVRSLVEILGGDIVVQSKYGQGTTFTIYLPIKVIDSDKEVENRSFISNKEMVDIEFSDLR